jgi:hypothetical protein
MSRAKSQLNEIIDREIAAMLETNGRASARNIYRFLVSSHDDVINAEVSRFVEAGVMRHIEHRLRSAEVETTHTASQLRLPGIPEPLAQRMGRVMTVEGDDGETEYIDVLDRRTTVGEVRRFVKSLEKQAAAIKVRVDAFVDVLNRCGLVTDDTPLHEALRAAQTASA